MPHREDPDDELVLDDDFVARATRREPSAAERAVAIAPRPARARRRRRDRSGVLALVTVGAVVAAGLQLHLLRLPGSGAVDGAVGGDTHLTTAGAYPPRADVHLLRRALPAPAVPPATAAGASSYRFLHEQDGHPVGWDPCAPVHLVVRARNEPPAGRVLLRSALDRLSTVTGLQFVVDGSTDESPSAERAPYQPQRYGPHWAPVLVAWSDPQEAPHLAGSVAGYTAPVSWSASRSPRERVVSGSVVLDRPQLEEDLADPAGQARVRVVLLHELGHLVGLDHVDDVGEVMNPTLEPDSPVDYGPGDLRGLALLGSGPCA